MTFLLVVAALIAAGAAYQAIGAYRDTRRHSVPGRLVDAGSVRLHLNEQGAGRPVVVLESGIAGSSLSWALVQPKVAAFTRVCSYDRAGLGWSEPAWSKAGAMPRTIEQMASELRALLSAAAIPGPYVLVGHSFGALLMRAYAHLRPGEVSGLVLVDPVSLEHWANCEPEERRRLYLGAKLSRRGAWLARFGIVRMALVALAAGGRWFPKVVARATAGPGAKVMEGLAGEVGKLPSAVWPLVRAHWSRPKCFEAMALYLEALPEGARAALQMPIPAEIPFIVLSAASATKAELAERDAWVEQNGRGTHVRVEGSGHWLPLEQPDVVVEAIRGLAEHAQEKQKPLNSLEAAEGSRE